MLGCSSDKRCPLKSWLMKLPGLPKFGGLPEQKIIYIYIQGIQLQDEKHCEKMHRCCIIMENLKESIGNLVTMVQN
uniref:Uncharacterized protein n=1 Tax=Glossina morsitans morsitans TaxID=37546 RepID=A0ABK9NFZ4_GLOMM